MGHADNDTASSTNPSQIKNDIAEAKLNHYKKGREEAITEMHREMEVMRNHSHALRNSHRASKSGSWFRSCPLPM
jgi:hypothetical protein